MFRLHNRYQVDRQRPIQIKNTIEIVHSSLYDDLTCLDPF